MTAKKKTEKKETIIEDVPTGTTLDGIAGMQAGEFTFDEISVVKVYKLFPGRPKPAFCFETHEEISETQLQNLYGGGAYTIEYSYQNGTKRLEHWEIADKPSTPETNKPRTIEDVQIAMLKEQSQMNRELLMAVLGRGNNVTPMTEIAQMWGLIHGANPSNNGNGTSTIDKMLSFLEKGIEIGAAKGGDMDWKSMLVSTVREIAPTITSVVAQAKGVQLPETTSAALALPEDQIQKGINTLKKQILGGMPVGLALDWVVANANEPQYQPLLQLALSKSFDDIVKIDNELANEPFNTWFRQFLEGLKAHFKEQSTTEDDEQQ